jgi:hypothetical protein
MYYVKNTAGRKLIPDDRCKFSVDFSMCLTNAGTVAIAFSAYSARSF